MEAHILVTATAQCATASGRLTGLIIIAAGLLSIFVCALGWTRALVRAHRAEGELRGLRQSMGPMTTGPA